MAWNGRAMRKGDEFAIHEVFFAEDGSIQGWAQDPVYPRADGLDDWRDELLQRDAAALDEARPAVHTLTARPS